MLFSLKVTYSFILLYEMAIFALLIIIILHSLFIMTAPNPKTTTSLIEIEMFQAGHGDSFLLSLLWSQCNKRCDQGLSLYDTLGRRLLYLETNDTLVRIGMEEFPSEIYFLSINNQEVGNIVRR